MFLLNQSTTAQTCSFTFFHPISPQKMLNSPNWAKKGKTRSHRRRAGLAPITRPSPGPSFAAPRRGETTGLTTFSGPRSRDGCGGNRRLKHVGSTELVRFAGAEHGMHESSTLAVIGPDVMSTKWAGSPHHRRGILRGAPR